MVLIESLSFVDDMRNFFYKQTLTTLLLFAAISVWSQKKFDNQITAASKSLEGKSLSGYSTQFDFDRESVRRGWWEYSREFGSPLNMKTYYKVKIPSTANEGNVDILIFTQTEAGTSGVVFFLGVESDQFKDQAKSLLQDFKKSFYIDDLLSQINDKQKSAKSLSDEYEDTVLDTKREELLSQITVLKDEIEKLKSEIRKIELK